MKIIARVFFALALIILVAKAASAQTYTATAYRSKVTDSTTVSMPTGYGGWYYNYQTGKIRMKDADGWFNPRNSSSINPYLFIKRNDTTFIKRKTIINVATDIGNSDEFPFSIVNSDVAATGDSAKINVYGEGGTPIAEMKGIASTGETSLFRTALGFGYFKVTNSTGTQDFGFEMDFSGGALFEDGRSTPLGLIYGSPPSAINMVNGSLVHKQYVVDNFAASSTVISGNTPIRINGGNSATLAAGPIITINNAAADAVTKGAATFTANDFNAASGLISIDYVNAQQATTSLNGFLSSTDWNTFNNKLSSSRTITTTAPLLIDGGSSADLSANRTLSVASATTAALGVASFNAADFDVVAGAVSFDNVNAQKATTSTNGILTSTDWNTFNSKQAGDADLTSIAGLGTFGLPQRTASNTYTMLQGSSNLDQMRWNSTSGIWESFAPPAYPLTTDYDLFTQISGAPSRIGMGSANQVLAVNSGGTAVGWSTITTSAWPLTGTGTFTGNVTIAQAAQTLNYTSTLGLGSATVFRTLTNSSNDLWTTDTRGFWIYNLYSSSAKIGSILTISSGGAGAGLRFQDGTATNKYNIVQNTGGGNYLSIAETTLTSTKIAIGLGTGSTANSTLHVKGAGTTTSTTLRVEDAASTARLVVLDNGDTRINGKLNVGANTSATASIDILAGTTAIAPLRLNSGPLLSTPLAGAVEFLTDKGYLTITTGTARKELTLNDAALTSGTYPIATTNGRLTDGAITSTNINSDYRNYLVEVNVGTANSYTSNISSSLPAMANNSVIKYKITGKGVEATGGGGYVYELRFGVVKDNSGNLAILGTPVSEQGSTVGILTVVGISVVTNSLTLSVTTGLTTPTNSFRIIQEL